MTGQARGFLRFLAFGLSFWSVGVILAAFFGLGWFFLLETVRRVLLAVPHVRWRLTRAIFGDERANGIRRMEDEAGSRRLVSGLLQVVITLAWIALTIFVFARFNIRLIDIFS